MTTVRKVALITGATGGIGSATALAFAKQGDIDLALHYNTASETVRTALLSDLKTASSNPDIKIHFFQADLATYPAVRRLHADITAIYPHIDILFNNAGSNASLAGVTTLADVPIEAFELAWRLNTGSAFLLTQLCLPAMEAQGYGRIVFNSSLAAFTGGVVGPHYASAKSALHGFVHWLGANVAKKGVTVNAVAPALVGGTGMVNPGSEEAEARLVEKLPVGRLGKPEEIAGTVLWMVNTPYLTRKIIGVDGGAHPY